MDNYLIHHGIKGQKWGIRRYQNPDGTLTKAGEERYKTDKKFAEKYDKSQVMDAYRSTRRAEAAEMYEDGETHRYTDKANTKAHGSDKQLAMLKKATQHQYNRDAAREEFRTQSARLMEKASYYVKKYETNPISKLSTDPLSKKQAADIVAFFSNDRAAELKPHINLFGAVGTLTEGIASARDYNNYINTLSNKYH